MWTMKFGLKSLEWERISYETSHLLGCDVSAICLEGLCRGIGSRFRCERGDMRLRELEF
jgi:hypothetical protein